ncbi:MAG TPA: TolC family protein [Tepidisphaeraceae bacterium]
MGSQADHVERRVRFSGRDGLQRPRPLKRTLQVLVLAALALGMSGCVLAPKGTDAERARAKEAGGIYAGAFDKRELPELPAEAGWREVLQRAFLANGDLEASYFEWQAALARIDMAAAWPNSNLQIGFEYMFSKERMKAWNRTTISAGFDPAMNLSLPVKTRQAGKVAFETARAAGYRFGGAKFELQRKVLVAYLDLALMEEKIRIGRDNVALLKLLTETASNRLQAGGPQQDLLKAQIEYRLAENELATMEADAQSMRAMLNGMLARRADAPLTLPSALPAPRPLAADDAALIAVATDQNPELSALARDVAGRKNALELARMAYLPDVNPVAGFTGDVSKFLGAMVMVPTTIPMIRGQINEARAMLRSAEAMARQTRSDRAASFVAALIAMRNAERQVALFRERILPAAQQVLNSSRQAYTAGSVGFADLIDSQRTLLEVRQMIAESRIERERRLAELEALAGVDIETLAGPTTRPATRASTEPVLTAPTGQNGRATTTSPTADKEVR